MFGLFKKKQETQDAIRKEQIFPRIKNEQYKSFLIENGIPQEHLELVEPIIGGLYLTYALDKGSIFEMLTPSHLEALGIKADELKQISAENFRNLVPSVQLQKYGNFYDVRTGHNLEACLLIDNEFWEEESKKLSGSLVAGVPHRDNMMFCDSNDPDALEGLKEYTTKFYNESQDNHSLSLNLLSWTPTGWQVFNT